MQKLVEQSGVAEARASQSATRLRVPGVWQRRLLALVWGLFIAFALGIAYYLAARLGLLLQTAPGSVAVIWPASGIAAGSLVALGKTARAPVALGVAVATVAASVITGKPLPLAAAFALCNAAECLLFAALIERFSGPGFNLDRLTRVVGFVAASVAAAAPSALAAALAIHAEIFSRTFFQTATAWFLSDTMGLLTVAPLFISVPSFLRSRHSISEIMEGILQLAVVAVVFLLLFSPPELWISWVQIAPGSVLFPILLWIGARSHPAVAAAASLIAACLVTATSVLGYGRLGDPLMPVDDRIYQVQLIMAGFAFAILTLTSLFAERRFREETLADNEHKLRLSNQAGGIGTFTVDVEAGLADYSPELATMTGFPGVRRATVEQAFARVHRDDVAYFKRRLVEAQNPAGDGSINVEIRYVKPGGAVRWMIWNGRVVFRETPYGRVASKFFGACVDITERKRTEQALIESEQRFKSMANTAPSILWVTESDGNFSFVSRGWFEFTGGADSECDGLDWLELVHPSDRERCRREFVTGVEQEKAFDVEYRLRRADGEYRWMIDSCRPRFDVDGRFLGHIGAVFDITDRKLAEEHQNLLMRELDHRVKNILARMSAIIELSRGGERSVDDFAVSLGGRIDSMARMHSRLSLSNWSGISVRTLVGDALETYPVEGRTELFGPEIILTPAATQALAMVLYELATNAVKYGALSSPFGIVRVKWEERGDKDGPNDLVLSWSESGGPPVKSRIREGYGSSVIRELVRYEIGGVTTLTFAPEGVVAEIIVPLSSVLDAKV